MSLSAQLQDAVRAIRVHADLRPRIGMVLGSGLGVRAGAVAGAVRVPYTSIPGFPPVGVEGHAGELVLGTLAGKEVAILSGRHHAYEGHRFDQIVYPTRVLAGLGAGILLVTNAAGGIRDDLAPGTILAIRDHINLMGGNPLVGPNDPELGVRFPDMSNAYDRDLRERALEAGREVGLELATGVYAACLGPSYETPAEIRMLRAVGADAVGMSTAPEVIAANHMAMKVLGLSLITNRAAGLSETPLSHQEVMETGRRARSDLIRLVHAILGKL